MILKSQNAALTYTLIYSLPSYFIFYIFYFIFYKYKTELSINTNDIQDNLFSSLEQHYLCLDVICFSIYTLYIFFFACSDSPLSSSFLRISKYFQLQQLSRQMQKILTL